MSSVVENRTENVGADPPTEVTMPAYDGPTPTTVPSVVTDTTTDEPAVTDRALGAVIAAIAAGLPSTVTVMDITIAATGSSPRIA